MTNVLFCFLMQCSLNSETCAICLCPRQALEEARQQLASNDVDGRLLENLEFPSNAEVLTTAAPGEICYMWQMVRSVTEDEDNYDNWINLPLCVCRVLDRELARFTCLKSSVQRPIVAFVIHLKFGTEMKYSWMLEQSVSKEVGRRWVHYYCPCAIEVCVGVVYRKELYVYTYIYIYILI